ncbi:MAG: branched-chain amino acid ABC transporter permease, partial [Firmicutes bacterium]|nr:branched-chain amino acid ABC transporter permease [Bacillota bacterium]
MFIQQLVNGLILGSTYALIALGYTMVYGIIELINFAHGEIYMFGAFAGLILVTVLNVPFFLAFFLAMALAAILGITIEFLAYRPLRRSSRLAALISAIGASIFLSNLARLIMGTKPHNFPSPFEPKIYETSLFIISRVEVIVLLSSFLLMIGLTFIVQKTKIGKAMRATA